MKCSASSRWVPGAPMGWHRDAPQLGAPIVGVSLGAACLLRFQHRAGGVRRVHEQLLEPRSAYALDGPARWAWQHHIARTEDLRYSVTFRTLRHPPPAPAECVDPSAPEGGEVDTLGWKGSWVRRAARGTSRPSAPRPAPGR